MARKKRRGPVSGLALHHELYTSLRQKLDDGTLAPGTVLPSEPHLAREYAVSRTTVRRALARLAREKRIERRHGSGTYVLDAKPGGQQTSVGPVPIEDLRTFGRRNSAKLVFHGIVPTPPFILKQHPEFGPECLQIRRTRSYEGRPFVFLTHYVPKPLAALLSKSKLGNKATIVAFDDAGHKPMFGEQMVTCVAADRVLARALRVPLGAPLLVVRRYVRDQHDAVLEFQEGIYRPDLYTVRTYVSREDVGERGLRWAPATAA